ncbi:MAG: insulinase family protein [bacterium]|nr:insulinase family protein [bacterium]
MSNLFNTDGNLHPSDMCGGLHLAVLPNGMKVIIKEDHRTPVAVCNVWVKVGSNREPQLLRGWSHGIEHMLFKGTEKRAEGDFAREVASAGGSTNAGTGYETTNYHITTPASELSTAVDILADSLFNSSFEPESLDAERQVLVHENHMYDDIPFGFGVTWRWGMELAFDRSPYSNPIGGRDENLLERDRDDILAFWKSAYRPDNMTVVVCGDVDPDEAFALIKDKFAPAENPTGESDPELTLVPAPLTENPHDSCRLRIEYGDIQRAYCKLIFQGPGEVNNLSAALSVVRRVLSDGRSCRLYRKIQEDLKLVDDSAVMTETGPREGVILIDMETDAQRMSQAIREIAGILADLSQNGCTEKELKRAQIRVMRGFHFGEETVQGQASTLGHNDAMGDLPSALNFPQQVAAVTSEQVAVLCRQYFRRNELSCVIYLPNGTDPQATGIPATVDELEQALSDILPAADGREKFSTISFQPSSGKQSKTASTNQPFTVHHLNDGTEVCLRQDTSIPIMTMALTNQGGSTAENARNSGLSTLTQMVQVKGTGNLDSEEIFESLEGAGSSISPRTERDFTGLFVSSLSDELDLPLEMTRKLIHAPSFPQKEIDQERRLALEQLSTLEDNPFQAAAVKLRGLIYGDHPYGRPLAGTLDSLPRLTREQMLDRHQENWTTGNLQITASGDFAIDNMLQRLEKLVEGLPKTPKPATPTPEPAQKLDGVTSARIQKEQNQSIVLTAWPGPMDADEDRFSLIMLKEVLNGQAGRLFEFLRNRKSLCYNTGTMSTAGYGQGMFLSYVLTAPESEEEARQTMLGVLDDLTHKPVDREEFEMARAKLLGNMLIASQSNSARVSRTANDRMLGRSANDFENVVKSISEIQPDDVLAAARKFIIADQRFEVVIGPS